MSKYFPLFVNLEGKKILVYGAGTIAARRIRTLLEFSPEITVIAPEVSEAVLELAASQTQPSVRLERRSYVPGELPADTYLVLAATNSREVNRAIWKECKEKHILVNVSSEKELCDFYFPGVVTKGELVVGVTAGGTNHALARKVTEQLKEELCGRQESDHR